MGAGGSSQTFTWVRVVYSFSLWLVRRGLGTALGGQCWCLETILVMVKAALLLEWAFPHPFRRCDEKAFRFVWAPE